MVTRDGSNPSVENSDEEGMEEEKEDALTSPEGANLLKVHALDNGYSAYNCKSWQTEHIAHWSCSFG